ncbi:type II secretion system protein [Candidatus Parcubacteria bacterium]|nr:type II secretion system protein [Candidatus Parcubacteria bacterium]MBI4385298.1 type II secretion system protein [Candidatus Parcubacteria bacterium]
MNRVLKSKEAGFTMIELLVVVAIIGLLASVILVSLNTVRINARNASRRTTLQQLQTALELYFDSNNRYPSTSENWYSSEPGDIYSNNNGNWIPGLTPTYMSVLPRDPRGGASPYVPLRCFEGTMSAYLYKSDGTDYKLLANCSPEGDWSATDPLYDPFRPTWAWMICSGRKDACEW